MPDLPCLPLGGALDHATMCTSPPCLLPLISANRRLPLLVPIVFLVFVQHTGPEERRHNDIDQRCQLQREFHNIWECFTLSIFLLITGVSSSSHGPIIARSDSGSVHGLADKTKLPVNVRSLAPEARCPKSRRPRELM